MHATFIRHDGSFGSVTGSEYAVRQFLTTLSPTQIGPEVEPLGLPVMNFSREEKAAPSYAGAAGHPGTGTPSYRGEEEPLGLPVMQF